MIGLPTARLPLRPGTLSWIPALLCVLAGGCGQPFLAPYEKICIGTVEPAGPGITAPDFSSRFRAELGRRLRAGGDFRLVEGPRAWDDATLILQGRTQRAGPGEPLWLRCTLKTPRGRPVLRAALCHPPLLPRAAEAENTAEILHAVLAEGRSPASLSEETKPPGAGLCPCFWERVGAPGRFSLAAALSWLPLGPGRAGEGSGAPDYADIFTRGRSLTLGGVLAANGFLEVLLEGGPGVFEGRKVRTGGLTVRFEDLRFWELRIGALGRWPLLGGDSLPVLWRFAPPFPDTGGTWVTFRVAGGLWWNESVDATVLAGGAGALPPVAEGVPLEYFREGNAFFFEAALGLTLQSWDRRDLLVSFAVEWGVRVGEPLEEGAGRASEGGILVLFPLRLACRFSF
jgi:hypothetical protein